MRRSSLTSSFVWQLNADTAYSLKTIRRPNNVSTRLPGIGRAVGHDDPRIPQMRLDTLEDQIISGVDAS